jgi:hypothetical protein
VTGYEILVRAYNWVGVSPDTRLVLSVIVASSSSAVDSTLESQIFLVDENGAHTGIAEALAAVPYLVIL